MPDMPSGPVRLPRQRLLVLIGITLPLLLSFTVASILSYRALRSEQIATRQQEAARLSVAMEVGTQRLLRQAEAYLQLLDDYRQQHDGSAALARFIESSRPSIGLPPFSVTVLDAKGQVTLHASSPPGPSWDNLSPGVRERALTAPAGRMSLLPTDGDDTASGLRFHLARNFVQHGKPAGSILISLRMQDLVTPYGEHNLGPRAVIQILADGVLMARAPVGTNRDYGRPLDLPIRMTDAPAGLPLRLEADAGWPDALKGHELTVRHSTLHDLSYLVSYSLSDVDDAMAVVRLSLGTLCLLFGGGSLVLALMIRRIGTQNAALGDALRARQAIEEELRIAAAAFESQECMVITDAEGTILRVNQAFTESTGYSPQEIVGKNPRLLKSGRHNPAFYRAMWQHIARHGSWQGEIWDRRKSGEEYPKWLTISAVKDADGKVTHYVGTHFDISERKRAEARIQELAFYDQLTGLPNRTLLLDRLKQAVIVSRRNGHQGALFFIDLDNFKSLNDTLGHANGDLLLQQVAQRLLGCIREGDTAARLGGDEFVIMLLGLPGGKTEAAARAEMVGEKILAALNRPYNLGGYEHVSTPSIGITLFGDKAERRGELLKQADLAMYQAKAAGRNAMRFFDPTMQTGVADRVAMEHDLRNAIRDGQLCLYYQPQVDASGRCIGAEALVRWHHPVKGLVMPDRFIPLAEETGLIVALGQWVLENVCRQQVQWQTEPGMEKLILAVNVSGKQLRQKDFAAQVIATVRDSGADPACIKLELTETQLLNDIDDSIEKMCALRQSGLAFALDDFGTGYSSLSYLKQLPLTQLKIDRSFVRDVLRDENDASIVRTIIALAQALGVEPLAEGVELAGQRDFLAESGCRHYQGHLFGVPMPVDAFEHFVAEQRCESFHLSAIH